MTQIEKIIAVMLQKRKEKEWFYAPDFQTSDLGSLYVGYEASARLTDVCNEFPELVQPEKRGKYRYVRFRYENLDVAYPKLPGAVKNIITSYGYVPANMPRPIPQNR